MELRQLELFVAVARAGSFSRAAEALDVPQPSVWRQVKALERGLGLTLFTRSGRGVEITSAGAQILPRIEQLLAQAGVVSRFSADLARGKSGVVTIGAANPHVPRFLAPLIGAFHQVSPGIDFILKESPRLPAIEQVLSGEVDLVTGLPRADRRLIGCKLGEVRLALVMSEDHPWRQRSEVGVAELRDARVLIGDQSNLSRRLLEPALRESGLALDIALEAATAPTLVSLARAGLGVAIVADDNLAGLSSTWPRLTDPRHMLTSEVWIYWARSRELAPAVGAFVRFVSTALGEES